MRSTLCTDSFTKSGRIESDKIWTGFVKLRKIDDYLNLYSNLYDVCKPKKIAFFHAVVQMRNDHRNLEMQIRKQKPLLSITKLH